MGLIACKYDAKGTFYEALCGWFGRADKYYGIPGGVSGAVQYVNSNRLRAGLVVAALTATYFMYPAYTALVNTTVAKVEASVSSAVIGLTTLAAANPLAAGLIMIAAVATIGVLAYMNEAGVLLRSNNLSAKIDSIIRIFGVAGTISA